MVEQSINYVFKGPVTTLLSGNQTLKIVFSVLYNITPHDILISLIQTIF